MAALDVSVLVSAALAVTWIFGNTRASPQAEASSNEGEAASSPRKTPLDLALGCALWVHSVNQLLPALLLAAAAASPVQAVQAAWPQVGSIDLDHPFGEETVTKIDAPDWLGHDAGFLRHLFLASSLMVWRAEKLESLLQRMQRSVKVAQTEGVGKCLSSFFRDPYAYGWPVFWGISRRVALVVVASCGVAPFMQSAYPAVVLDECLWWVVANFQGFWDRKVTNYPVPAVVNIIVLPLLDLLHFLPVLVKVFFLGLTAYPFYDKAGVAPGLLVASAFAWTAHNLHMLYTTVFLDLPESARALWAARHGEGGGN